MWANSTIKLVHYAAIRKYQKVNHFPRSWEMTRKDTMYSHLKKLKDLHGDGHFKFLPESFVLPEGLD